MRDAKVSLPRINLLHPMVRDEVVDLIEVCEKLLGAKTAVRIIQGLRTFAEQDALYAQGRTKPGTIVTQARAGESYHCFGVAIDYALLYDKDNSGTFETLSWSTVADFNKDGKKDWTQVANLFKDFDWVWGGNFKTFKDYPHLEKNFGYSCKELLAKYNNKAFIPGTTYVHI